MANMAILAYWTTWEHLCSGGALNRAPCHVRGGPYWPSGSSWELLGAIWSIWELQMGPNSSWELRNGPYPLEELRVMEPF